MMSDKISIFLSFYKDFFENVKSDDIYLLSKQLSTSVWSRYIDEKANTYFHLPDNNWLVTSKYIIAGEWIESFNTEEPKKVKDLLSKSVDWPKNERVFFCINKDNVIETVWEVFTTYWIKFLYCENDCPILIAENNKKEAIIFTAIGDFVVVKP
jgi:hypothetical protein